MTDGGLTWCGCVAPCVGHACVVSVNGTSIVQYAYYDDDGDAANFVLLNNVGPFSVTTAGLLYVDTSKGWLNYESLSSYSLSIGLVEVSNKLSSSPLLWAAQGNTTNSISVVDVNEYPYFRVLPNNYSIDEESVYPTSVTPYTSNGNMTMTLNPLVLSSYNGVYITVYDDDGGNNSAVVVSVTSFSSANGSNSAYFEVVNATGGICRGNQNCTLRVRSGAPRMNYDAPDALRWVNVTLTVTDPTGLTTTASTFNVTINDVNQAPRILNYPLSTVLVSENR